MGEEGKEVKEEGRNCFREETERPPREEGEEVGRITTPLTPKAKGGYGEGEKKSRTHRPLIRGDLTTTT